jgi:hypothetical protein
MAYAKKPAFETFRAHQIAHGKPLLEKDIVPIQARIIAHLDTIRELLVQKSKRHGDKMGLVEISATWVGLDANPRDAISTLKRSWPGTVFDGVESQFWIGESEESVLLEFTAKYPEDRYLTGRVLVVF